MIPQKFGQSDKIAIIGARGNLGSQLARVLGNEYRLLLWDREELDITDRERVVSKIIEHKPHFILNCAAYNAVDKCETDDGEYALALQLNRDAVACLADAALATGAALVHFSTDYVFPGDSQEGYREDAAPSPVNRYGQTKLAGEKEILSRASRGLKYLIIRTSKLFGPTGDSVLAKANFFDIMLKLAKEKGEVSVVDGEISNFTYTPDLAKAIKGLIQGQITTGLYHLTNQGAVSWYEGAKTLFKLAGMDVKVAPIASVDLPRPAKRPVYSVLLNTKLPKLRPYEEALEEYLKTN